MHEIFQSIAQNLSLQHEHLDMRNSSVHQKLFYSKYIQINHTYMMLVQSAACLENWALPMETSGLSGATASRCLTACPSNGADCAAVTFLFENLSEKEDLYIAGTEKASSSSLTVKSEALSLEGVLQTSTVFHEEENKPTSGLIWSTGRSSDLWSKKSTSNLIPDLREAWRRTKEAAGMVAGRRG